MPDPDHLSLRDRVDKAGYTVIRVREIGRDLVWTLAPHLSQVEFEVVGNEELLRFLAHS